MKRFNFKKLLMALAVVIIIQNGSIIVQSTAADSDEGGISTYSDRPCPDDDHS